MQVHPTLVEKSFSRAMDTYDEHAVVQRGMAEELVANIKNTLPTDGTYDVFEVGSGTGLLTREIVRNYYIKNYHATDLVKAAGKCARRIVGEYSPSTSIVFEHGNVFDSIVHTKVDMVVSNAVFQWFEDINAAVARMKKHIKRGGVLAFTTFSPLHFKEVSAISGVSLKYNNLMQIWDAIGDNGLSVRYINERTEKLNFESPMKVLAHMKATGVNAFGGDWPMARVKNFCREYANRYPDIALTYAPITVIAGR